MCDPVSAAIAVATVAGSKYVADEQNAKAERRMKKQQEDAKASRAAEKKANDANALEGNTPLLIKSGTGKAAKGMSQLKVPGGSASGYSSVGMGGTNSTGLNISNG